MARHRKMPGMTGVRMARRIQAVRADSLAIGDVLWSSATDSALRIIAVEWQTVRADGNLLVRDPEVDDGSQPLDQAIVFTVQRASDNKIARIGAFAPRARLQRLRYVPVKATKPVSSQNGR